jgi:stress-induced morphogen
MPLQILSSPPPEPAAIAGRLRERILAELPDAEVRVIAESPGHFSIEVVSAAFEGKSRVVQQQMVYRAIRELMDGDTAPVHAIDRMVTQTA